MDLQDRFGNAPVAADFKLIRLGTTWELKEKAGFFGDCQRCGLQIESAPEPVKFWLLRIGIDDGHRYFCLDCGDFLKQVDEMERG